MKLILAIAMAFSVSAFAADYEQKELNFKVSERTRNGNLAYYNCDSVESTVKKSLIRLGAKNVVADCRGGIDRHGSHNLPAYVSLSFEALNAEIDGNKSVAYQEVKFNNRNNCHLVNSIVKAVTPHFEIEEIKMKRCFRSDANAKISVLVLKEI